MKPNRKHTVSTTLTDREFKIVTKLAEKRGMSVEALLRTALRVHQRIDLMIEKGEFKFTDEAHGCGSGD